MGDRYTITERVDQGGMAEVFRGVAESLQGFKKNVAIKRILPSLTKNKKFVAMFLDEAKLSLFLQHANIVQVFDIGVSDNAYFLVMEYVDGCNLKQLIERIREKGKRMEVAHAIYLLLETCKALNYAHHTENPETGQPLNIVHRDISPPNILISKMGEVKVVDFGLAKANSQIESTDPGVVKGKFSYLSPEAASGLEVDHRADIFALGILLWEMLTGRRLFYGETDYQTVELVRQARVPSIAALNPEIEPELEGIARKALARDPDERYQSAADMGDALAQYLFSRRMKVTARDIAALVRDVQVEHMRKRSLAPKESIIDALIQDEMGKLTSLIEDESPAMQSVGASSLDPNSFVDTSSWVSDLGFSGLERHEIDTPPPEEIKTRPPSPPLEVRSPTLPPAPEPPAGEIEPLQHLLEPDRTGIHNLRPRRDRRIAVALVSIVLLATAIGAGLFLYRDHILESLGDVLPGSETPAGEPRDTPGF